LAQRDRALKNPGTQTCKLRHRTTLRGGLITMKGVKSRFAPGRGCGRIFAERMNADAVIRPLSLILFPASAVRRYLPADALSSCSTNFTDPPNVVALSAPPRLSRVRPCHTSTRHIPEATGALAKAASFAPLSWLPARHRAKSRAVLPALKQTSFFSFTVFLDIRWCESDLAALPLRAPLALVLCAEANGPAPTDQGSRAITSPGIDLPAI